MGRHDSFLCDGYLLNQLVKAQRANDVKWRRINVDDDVMTSHQSLYDIILASNARWKFTWNIDSVTLAHFQDHRRTEIFLYIFLVNLI